MKQTYYRITTESGSLYEIDLADDGTKNAGLADLDDLEEL